MHILVTFSDEKFDFFVTSFNSFSINDSGQRENIWMAKLLNESLAEVLSFVNKIYEKKIDNLHGFVLKALVINENKKSSLNEILKVEVIDVFKRTLKCNFNFIKARDGLLESRFHNRTFAGCEKS